MGKARKLDVAFGARVEWTLLAVRLKPGCTDLNQSVVAQRMGKGKDVIEPSTVSRWKAGVVPSVATIRRLAVILRVDPGWLAFGEGNSAAPVPGGWAQSEQAARVRAEDIDRRRADVSAKRARKTAKRKRA